MTDRGPYFTPGTAALNGQSVQHTPFEIDKSFGRAVYLLRIGDLNVRIAVGRRLFDNALEGAPHIDLARIAGNLPHRGADDERTVIRAVAGFVHTDQECHLLLNRDRCARSVAWILIHA